MPRPKKPEAAKGIRSTYTLEDVIARLAALEAREKVRAEKFAQFANDMHSALDRFKEDFSAAYDQVAESMFESEAAWDDYLFGLVRNRGRADRPMTRTQNRAEKSQEEE